MIATHRRLHDLSGARLRRGRALYVRLARAFIKDTASLDYCARRMQHAGLYCESTPHKDVRFAILRRLWRLDGGSYYGLNWHAWLNSNGWSVGFRGAKWTKEAA